jgi:ubiquitin-conjugating enzyme E2 variant
MIMDMLLKILVIVLIADFISGFVHWLEDAYARPDMPLVGTIAKENLLHHSKPRDFLKKTWWQSSYDLIGIGLVVCAAAWMIDGTLSVWLLLLMGLSINANQIHKWSHQSRTERPRLISKLQDWKILQGARQHGKHHSGQKNTYYCVITNVLNPILERAKFWVGLEAAILLVTGVERRQEA